MKWDQVEDFELKQVIREYGEDNWSLIHKQLKTKSKTFFERTTEECKLRWSKVLKPKFKKEKWTDRETNILFHIHSELGSKWIEIAKRFPGRDENCVKNHFYASLRKKLRLIHRLVFGGKKSTEKINKIKSGVFSHFFDGQSGKKIGKFTLYELLEIASENRKANEEEMKYFEILFQELNSKSTEYNSKYTWKKEVDLLKIQNKNSLRSKVIKRRESKEGSRMVNEDSDHGSSYSECTMQAIDDFDQQIEEMHKKEISFIEIEQQLHASIFEILNFDFKIDFDTEYKKMLPKTEHNIGMKIIDENVEEKNYQNSLKSGLQEWLGDERSPPSMEYD